jgi:Fibronectin type III domain
VLKVRPRSQLKDLTMAGIFFESREPPIDEFSFADLKARFPEGRYRVRGQSFDGTQLVGSALFTHDVPAAPKVTAPLDGANVDPKNLTVRWNDVTKTVDGEPVDITGYEVIVTKEQHVDPHGFSQPIFDVHVPPDRNSLSVSERFLEPDTEYELEVLALEKSGNQTISVSFFTTK